MKLRPAVSAPESLEDRLTPATFTVTNYFDLVFAVQAANANGEDDTVTVAADITYSTQIPLPEGIAVGEAGKAIALAGAAGTRPTLDADHIGRLFHVTAGTATFTDLTLTGGQYLAPSDVPARGGAVLVEGGAAADFTRVTLAGNTAQGGRLFGGAAASGGAVYTDGTVTAADVVFDGNTAHGSDGLGGAARGGAIAGFGNVTVTRAVFQNNTAVGGSGQSLLFVGPGGAAFGGAVAANGELRIYAALLGESNAATGGAGGAGGGAGGAARGGAVYAAGPAAVLGNCTVAGNVATGGAGGGTGPAGAAGAGGVEAADNRLLTLASTTVAGNLAAGVRLGAGAQVTLFNSLFDQNTGGGLVGDATAAVAAALGNYFETAPPYAVSATANTVGGSFTLPALGKNGTVALDAANTYFRRTFALPPGAPPVGIGDVSKLTADLIGPDTVFDGRGNAPRVSGGRTDAGSYQSTATPAPTGFRVDLGAAPVVAGTPFTVTVTAVDAAGGTFTAYTGPATLTATNGGPVQVAFTNGVGAATATVGKAGPVTLTVADDAAPTIRGTADVTVRPLGLLVTTGAVQQAGTPFLVTVAALDPGNTTAIGFSGPVRLTLTGGGTTTVVQDPLALVGGTGTVTVSVPAAGVVTLTATDGTLTATATVDVRAGGFRLTVVDPPRAGAAGRVTVTALDAAGDTDAGFASPVTVTLGGATVSVPSAAFAGGVATVTLTPAAAGPAALAVVDAATGLVGTLTVTVLPNRLVVTLPTAISAKDQLVATVAAVNPGGGPAAYAGPITVTATLNGILIAIESVSAVGADGRVTVRLTPRAAGTLVLTATDTAVAAVTGTATAAVGPAAAVGFRLTVPSAPTAGVAFLITVTAVDLDGLPTTSFNGPVNMTSNRPGATFGPAVLADGTAAVTVTLTDSNTTTLTATAGGRTGSTTVAVVAGYTLTPARPPVVGTDESFVLRAGDAAGQPVAGGINRVTLSGVTGTGVPVPDFAVDLVNGEGQFQYTPTEPGTVTFRVIADTVTLGTVTADVAPFTALSTFQPLGSALLPDEPAGPVMTAGRYYTDDGRAGDEPAIAGFGSPLSVTVLAVNPNHVSRYGLPQRAYQEGPSSNFTATDFEAAALSHYSAGSTGGRSANEIGTVANDFIAASPLNGQVTLVYDGARSVRTGTCGEGPDVVGYGRRFDVFQVGGNPSAAAAAHLNSSGFTDVVIAQPLQGTLNVIRNLGDGGPRFGEQTAPPLHFAPFSHDDDIVTGGQPAEVLAAPLLHRGSGDDLAVADLADDTILILNGFNVHDVSTRVRLVMPVGYTPRRMTSANFDGDDNPDLAVVGYNRASGTSIVAVYYGDGAGHFTAPQVYDAPAGNGSGNDFNSRAVDIVAADVNGDGRKDLLVVGNREGSLGVLFHDAKDAYPRAFTALRRYSAAGAIGDYGYFPTALEGVTTGDFNNDGHPDAAVLGNVGGVRQVVLFHAIPLAPDKTSVRS